MVTYLYTFILIEYMFGFTKEEVKLFKSLNNPKKIQDFLNQIPINKELNGDTCISPKEVLKQNHAHCIEGAMLAATILRFYNQPPLLLDLTASKRDFDHVVALFKKDGYWGAISKTNHAVLRYREPIYKTIRELALSYFHEYFLNENGKKTLRSYSIPINLSKLDYKNWMTSEKNVWCVPEYLIKAKHYPILTKKQILFLRKAEPIEIEAGKLIEWK